MMAIWGNIPFKKRRMESLDSKLEAIREINEKYLKMCQETGVFSEEHEGVLFCMNPDLYAVRCKYRKERKPEEGAGVLCARWIDYERENPLKPNI